MKKNLLLSLFSLISCQSVVNPINCKYGGTTCLANEYCESLTESCLGRLSLTDITPKAGPQGAATLITLTGTGFMDGMTVSVGGVAATNVTVKSATELTAMTPPSPGRCGPANVHLTNKYSATADKVDGFRYLSTGAPNFTSPAINIAQDMLLIDQILITDINGDLQPDVIVKNPTSVAVCPGSAQGVTSCNTQLSFLKTQTYSPNIMRIHDFNFDKNPDIFIFPHASTAMGGALIMGTTTPNTFMPALAYSNIANVNDILPVDRVTIQGSNAIDLWTATTDNLQVIPYTSPAATTGTTVLMNGLTSLQVARPDTATGGAQLIGVVQPSGVLVVDRTMPGTALAPQFLGLTLETLRIADINGDGEPDLIGATAKGSAFFLALGQSTRTYLAPTAIASDPLVTSSAFEVADLACDGNPGLVVLTSGHELAYLQRSADGSTSVLTVLVMPLPQPNTITFAVKDLNGDGRPDLIYTIAGGLAISMNSAM